jgi:molybdenum transport protein
MPSLPPSFLDRLLAEDVPNGDLTTLALGIGGMPGVMEFRARGDMVVAGIEIAADMIRRVGADASTLMPSGPKAKAGTLLLTAKGSAAALHHSWKAAQTLTEILSGIATATRALVDAVEAVDANVRVACTRKTVPGARQLSVIAIRAGGAVPHRLGLSE